MYDVEYCVVIFDVGYDYVKCVYVVQFGEIEFFVVYFVLDVVDMFWLVVYVGLDVCFCEFVLQLCDCLCDVCFVFDVFFVEQFCDLFVGDGIFEVECEIFEFLFQLLDIEMVCEWCIDFECFVCDVGWWIEFCGCVIVQ